MKHPAAETLRRFIRGEGSPAENREVVVHLLRGCKICSKIVREAILPEKALGALGQAGTIASPSL
jgi:hypothetical protein